MSCKEKPNFREENHKPRKSHRNTPSFSSSLLDEIYRSIDGNAEKAEEFKAEKPAPRGKSSSKGDDQEMARFTRACLVDKWMEKEVHEKARRRPPESSFQDNDVLFFSSTSTSSDSSGALSSSDTELFCSGAARKPKQVSCFSTRPKPVRTGSVPARESNHQHYEFLVSDDDQLNQQKNKDSMKSKSRALRIYAGLKKLKQPVSPGGRLTSFINSLFTNSNSSRKSRKPDANKGFQDLKSTRTTASSACSSATSYSRSCMSKYSSSPDDQSRDKTRNGNQRTVRFHPVGVIVDQDSKACGQKSILYDEDSCDYKHGRPPLPPLNKRVEEAAHHVSKGSRNHRNFDFSMFRKIRDEIEDDEDDAASESSSDLFELDHSTVFGKNRFCEELPVYETTYFFT
ncbi:protein BIG GRAIN 1-like B [Sesamum alatum]|uniref:Protein BIG GRAIN 1-like B n=1 Tax=Sesamum alatum TaxID=300844 RepID=A0AAE2CHC3_9LAMI|nr:protein BIG GRAIN 1-like B [Sesamum alatum]